MEAKKRETLVNGVNIEQLFSTIDLIKEKPDVAKFKFRATNKWVSGTHCRATVKSFYGALKEDDSREPRVFDMDEPPVLLGIIKEPILWSISLSPCRAALPRAWWRMPLRKE